MKSVCSFPHIPKYHLKGGVKHVNKLNLDRKYFWDLVSFANDRPVFQGVGQSNISYVVAEKIAHQNHKHF